MDDLDLEAFEHRMENAELRPAECVGRSGEHMGLTEAVPNEPAKELPRKDLPALIAEVRRLRQG
jgi:hypothetical protein